MYTVEIYNLVTKTFNEYTTSSYKEALIMAKSIASVYTVQVNISEVE